MNGTYKEEPSLLLIGNFLFSRISQIQRYEVSLRVKRSNLIFFEETATVRCDLAVTGTSNN
jgi:hypothetical protein